MSLQVEQGFGHNFRDVRVHDRNQAGDPASSNGAGQLAIQRKEYEPSLPFLGPLTMGFDYLLHRGGPSSLPPINDPSQPSIHQMVQEHIARVQGAKAFHEGEHARKHDKEIEAAQRAITGLPPDWSTWGEDPPGPFEQPEYEDVSPALNPRELADAEREREFLEEARR